MMTGDPTLGRASPITFEAVHTEMATALDHIIDRMADSDVSDRETERQEANVHWADYEQDLARSGRLGRGRIVCMRCGGLTSPNDAMHFVNACRMAFIDPQRHGALPLQHSARHHAFKTLQKQVNATGGNRAELMAYMVAAIFRESPLEALQAYHALADTDPAWARHALKLARTIVSQEDRFEQEPIAVATAKWLLEEMHRQLPHVAERLDRPAH